jgi:hypothetical protein
MTATLDAATRKEARPELIAEHELAYELVARGLEHGGSLTGPDDVLKQLTKTVLETPLNRR